MSLRALAKSLRKGEILLPRLKRFLREEYEKQEKGKLRHRDIVVRDARMTIDCFKERIKEYNHGEFAGEFYHPSALGCCQRQLWFEHKNAPKDIIPSDEDLLRETLIFETGTYVGVMFQNLCERAGLLIGREIPIVDRKLRILGHLDGELRIDDYVYVLEIKTINSGQFSKLKEPKKAHVQQVHAYMKSRNRVWAIILYLEKDRHSVKEFVVPFNAKFYQEHVARRIDLYFRSLKTTTPPEREGDNPNFFPCAWCNFRQVCFGTRELKRFLKTLKPKVKFNGAQ